MNNILKRFFIMPYIALNTLALIYSLIMIVLNPTQLAWWGAALATAPMTIYITHLMLAKKGRVAAKLHLGLVAAIVGAVLSMLAYSSSMAVFISVGLGVIGLILYDYWYSPAQRVQHEALKVGSRLPAIELRNLHGELENSQTWNGKAFFLMFIRGNWCPLCVAQVAELANIYQQITSKGVDIKVVAAQGEDATRKLAKRFNVPMQFYIDENNQVASQYALLHEAGVGLGIDVMGYEKDTFYPTVLLVNAEQKIVYADLTDNYRVRPEPQVLLQAVNHYL